MKKSICLTTVFAILAMAVIPCVLAQTQFPITYYSTKESAKKARDNHLKTIQGSLENDPDHNCVSGRTGGSPCWTIYYAAAGRHPKSGAWFRCNADSATMRGFAGPKDCGNADCAADYESRGGCGQSDSSSTDSDTPYYPTPHCSISVSGKSQMSPGETTVLTANLGIGTTSVDWEMETHGDVRATLKPFGTKSRYARLTVHRGSGGLTVRGTTTAAGETCEREKSISVEGCGDCAGAECSNAPGGMTAELDSVNIRFPLGKAGRKKSAGFLYIYETEMSEFLATPAALRLFAGTAVLAADGSIRQIFESQTFVDIVSDIPNGYEIRFYDPRDYGDWVYDENRHAIAEGAEPHDVWRVENPDHPSFGNRLRISEIRDGNVVGTVEYAQEGDTWTMTKDGGMQTVTQTETYDEGGLRTVTETVADASGTIASAVAKTYRRYDWGEELVREVSDPDGAGISADFAWYETGGEPGYSKIKSEIRSDGSWTRYEYDADGRKIKEIAAYLDNGIEAPENAVRVTTFDYTPVDPEDTDFHEFFHLPRTVVESVAGRPVSKTFYAYMRIREYSKRFDVEIAEQCAVPDGTYGGPGNLRTKTLVNLDSYAETNPRNGEPYRVEYPDGSIETYFYDEGFLTENPDGPDSYEPPPYYDGSCRDCDHTRMTVFSNDRTRRERTVSDRLGNEVFHSVEILFEDEWIMTEWRETDIDDLGRPVRIDFSDGTYEEIGWSCCGKSRVRERNGMVTRYEYDDLKRIDCEIREGVGSDIPDLYTHYEYDAAGRTVGRTVSAGGLNTRTETEYDLAGRITRSVDGNGLITAWQYPAQRTTREIRPGGGAIETERHADGRVKRVSETGLATRWHWYNVTEDGERLAGVLSEGMWEKTFEDFTGRTVRVERSGFGGITETHTYAYGPDGRLSKTTVPGMSAPTLHEYEDLGATTIRREGLDMDGDGILALDSEDRVAETETRYIMEGGELWRETVSRVYRLGRDNYGRDVPEKFETGSRRDRLTGFGNGVVAESVTVDIRGNETNTRTEFVPRLREEIRTVDHPDSDFDEKITIRNGQLRHVFGKTGLPTKYYYDALGRKTGTGRLRTGTDAIRHDANGRVRYTEDAAGHRTEYTWYPDTGAVRTVTNAKGRVTRYAYNDRGQATHVWGDAVKPVRYVYDAFGRLAEMHTFRGGAGFGGDTWPAGSEGPADVTKWRYDPSSGLLAEKEDAAGNVVSYTWLPGGLPHTRTLARTKNGAPVTTWHYDGKTGELKEIAYSDDTPHVLYDYDRMGRVVGVTDALGFRTLRYSGYQLTSVRVDGMSRTVRKIDSLGRYAGNTHTTWNYDAKGRVETVEWRGGCAATYKYLENGDLPESLTVESPGTGNKTVTTYGYEPRRDLRTMIRNEFRSSDGTELISQYDHTYDGLGGVESETARGKAVNMGLTQKSLGSEWWRTAETVGTGLSIDPETREYVYDNIGNRESATGWKTDTPESLVYEPNTLNQYDRIDHSDGTRTGLKYDADGNLTEVSGPDGIVHEYEYDAENRLVRIAPKESEDGVRAGFVYDYMGRRVEMAISVRKNGKSVLAKRSEFIYDGWNVICENSSGNGFDNKQTQYIWGPDLSGTAGGAGGVGGLLAVSSSGVLTEPIRHTIIKNGVFLYAGNGNVAQIATLYDHYAMVDGERAIIDPAGSVTAHYEYDPFGNIACSAGTMAEENPFRFSTKWHDDGAGLVYYGYRYYSPELGRWINRDPIGENGGVNLYAFVGNNPLSLFDYLGREPVKSQATNLNELIRELKKIEGDKSFKDTLNKLGSYPFGGIPSKNPLSKHRYVYTTKGGWIDITHLLGVAYKANKQLECEIENEFFRRILRSSLIAYLIARSKLWEETVKIEEIQRKNAPQSVWSYEDGPSNLYGLHWYFLSSDNMKLSTQLNEHLEDLGATAPENAPNWNKMPLNEILGVPPTMTNKSFNPIYTLEPLIIMDENHF